MKNPEIYLGYELILTTHSLDRFYYSNRIPEDEQDVLDSLSKSLKESVMEENSCYTKKLYDDSIIAVLFEGNYYDGDFEVVLVD